MDTDPAGAAPAPASAGPPPKWNTPTAQTAWDSGDPEAFTKHLIRTYGDWFALYLMMSIPFEDWWEASAAEIAAIENDESDGVGLVFGDDDDEITDVCGDQMYDSHIKYGVALRTKAGSEAPMPKTPEAYRELFRAATETPIPPLDRGVITYVVTPPDCELCAVEGHKNPAEYDLELVNGLWGFVCGDCRRGTAPKHAELGMGKGQALVLRPPFRE